MIISNLNYMEIVSEEKTVEGGFAFADAIADADAFGNDLSDTFTVADTFAISVVGANTSGSYSLSGSMAI